MRQGLDIVCPGIGLEGLMGKFRKTVLMILGCTSLLAVSCVSPDYGAVPPPPSTTVWLAGDSIGWATASHMQPLPYPTAVGGAGFTELSNSLILNHALLKLDLFDDPEYMIVIGGTNDAYFAQPTSNIIAGMQAFEDAMDSRGITTVWLAEPAWSRASEMAPLADWVATRPLFVDCRAVAGSSTDGVHPDNVGPFGQCVSSELDDLGITWNND